MIKSYFLYLIILLALLYSSCQKKINTEADLYHWINNPDNGLLKTVKANKISYSVKFLPPELCAFREWKSNYSGRQTNVDSLISEYRETYAFLLTIEPNKEKKASGDIMYKDINDYTDYKARVMDMNFHLEDFIKLKTEKGVFKPVLTTLENTYSSTDKRTIYLLFADDNISKNLSSSEDFELIFTDDLLNTGVHHFQFKKSNLSKIKISTSLFKNPSR